VRGAPGNRRPYRKSSINDIEVLDPIDAVDRLAVVEIAADPVDRVRGIDDDPPVSQRFDGVAGEPYLRVLLVDGQEHRFGPRLNGIDINIRKTHYIQ
jgi:hypothetical protein